MSKEPAFQEGRSVPHWHGFDNFHEHFNGDLMHSHGDGQAIARRSKPRPGELRVATMDWLWVAAVVFAVGVLVWTIVMGV